MFIQGLLRNEQSLIPDDFVIVAKQFVLVMIQIYWFGPENNVIDANRQSFRAQWMLNEILL